MFRKIGYFEIAADDDVIRVWSSPVFNLESAQEYAAAMTLMIESMPPAFGVLVEFDAPPIIGPEVEESMRQTARHRAERGMVAVAFVTAVDAGLPIASDQWQRIYQPIGVPHAFFPDVESARPWLREHIRVANQLGRGGARSAPR